MSEVPGGPPSAAGHFVPAGGPPYPRQGAPGTALPAGYKAPRPQQHSPYNNNPQNYDQPRFYPGRDSYITPVTNPAQPESPPTGTAPYRPLPTPPAAGNPVQPGLFRAMGGTDLYNNAPRAANPDAYLDIQDENRSALPADPAETAPLRDKPENVEDESEYLAPKRHESTRM